MRLANMNQKIAGRKQTKEAQPESEAYFRSLADNLPDIVARFDRGLRYLYINPVIECFFGLPAEAFIGKTNEELGITSAQVHLWNQQAEAVFQTGQLTRVEFAFPSPDGERQFHSLIVPEFDGDGAVKSILAVTRDVTDFKRVEAALRESNRQLQETMAELAAIQQQAMQQERLAAVNQLAAGMAHDFNNLLTAIIGLAELLRLNSAIPAAAQSDLERIVQQGRRGARLVHQVLDFSRTSFYQPRHLNLVSLIQEIIELLRQMMPEDISLELELDTLDLPIWGDPTQLQQVLINLALNARDAMPAGGVLKLRLTPLTLKLGEQPPQPELSPGRWGVLSIADTGAGIPAEVLPHIFEPFFTTKEAGQGSGLGLAQVYGIIRRHGGYVDAISLVGQGTIFTVYLPIH
jgi:PAS domain S-box-containing protein